MKSKWFSVFLSICTIVVSCFSLPIEMSAAAASKNNAGAAGSQVAASAEKNGSGDILSKASPSSAKKEGNTGKKASPSSASKKSFDIKELLDEDGLIKDGDVFDDREGSEVPAEAAEAILKTETEEEEFDEQVLVDGVLITVTAPAGVFPAGSTLSAKKITREQDLLKIREAVGEVRPSDQNTASSFCFDISVLLDGEEIQPDTEKGSVQVSFCMKDQETADHEVNVYHVTEETGAGQELKAEALEVRIEENPEQEGSIISAETESFSVYVVEFAYNTYDTFTYCISMDDKVLVSYLVEQFPIVFAEGETLQMIDVDDDLIQTEEVGYGDWLISAKKYFSTPTVLRITTTSSVSYDIRINIVDLAEQMIYWGKSSDGTELKISSKPLPAGYTGGSFKADSGELPWYRNLSGITTVTVGGDEDIVRPLTTEDWFSLGSSIEAIDLIGLDTRFVTDMSEMFQNCESLTSLDLSKFNTKNVTDMGAMFSGCKNLTNLVTSDLDTSNVTNLYSMFNECSSLTSLDITGFDTSNAVNMNSMFAGCSGLTSLAVDYWDMSNVKDAGFMFENCSGLTTLDVSAWDTSNITNMYGMFSGCSGLTTLNVSSFNTKKVTDTGSMFFGCSKLSSLDVSGFDMSNVTYMSSMFSGCSSLTSLNLSGLVTSNVEFMSYLFAGCSKLTDLGVSSFNTSKVIFMDGMFSGCSSLTSLDLSGFDTSAVSTMERMFCEDISLKSIYAGDNWITDSVTGSSDMFTGCLNLKGQAGTVYNGGHTDKEYARPDLGTSMPGYLSAKDFIPVTGVTVDPASISAIVGDTVQLAAAVTPAGATVKTVIYESDDTSVATVSDDGLVTALKVGTAAITVTTSDGGKTAVCEVTVSPINVTSVTLSPSSLSLETGTSSKLSATILPSDATDQTVTYSSSDTSVATVADDGTVTAVKTGTAVITVTTSDGGKTAVCEVTVSPINVTSVTLSPSSLSLETGTSSKLSATILPSDATDQTVTYTSSDTSVATVTSDGTVTAVKAGTAVITVKTTDGGKEASCTATVTDSSVYVTEVKLSKSTALLGVGQTMQLNATVLPDNASDKTLTWTSSNPSVVEVSADGSMKAVGAGTAVITAAANGAVDAAITASCNVTVKDVHVGSVKLSGSRMEIVVGTGQKLYATVSPVNATNKSLSWTSSDPSVATVAFDGTVTARGYGTCTITVTTADGGKSASATVTAVPKNGWFNLDGRSYWYENGVRQGTTSDPKGVYVNGSNIGRELYDPGTDAWYWLDATKDGAKAVNTTILLPYTVKGGPSDEKRVHYGRDGKRD